MEILVDISLVAALILINRYITPSKFGLYIRTAMMIFSIGIVHLFQPSLSGVIEILAVLIFLALEKFKPRREYGHMANDDNVMNITYLLLKHLVVISFLPLILTYFGSVSWGLSANNVPIIIQGLLLLVIVDFKQYWVHRGQHGFDIWWSFHKTHHSSTKMNIFAADRTNLIDWFLLQEVTTVVIFYMLGASTEAYLYYYIPGSLVARYVSHANIELNWTKVPLWAYIVGSPPVHALHHTISDDRVNFGEVFMFWDLIFGTFKSPIGISGEYGTDDISQTSILKQQLYPYRRKRA